MRLPAYLLAVLGLLLSAAGDAHALDAPATRTEARTRLQHLAQSARHPDLRWPVFSDFRSDVEQLYGRADWLPLWLERQRPTEAAIQLIARLAAADSLGLDPEDYDADWLTRTAGELAIRHAPPTADVEARFDLALAVAAVRFVRALNVGRVSPGVVDAQVFVPIQPRIAALEVDSLRDAGLQAGVLQRVQSTFHHYQLLKNGLARYRMLARDTTLALVDVLPRDLQPGMPLPCAARLRHLLEATGDMIPAKQRPEADADTLYVADLVGGVKQFQRRHGFEPDGWIYAETADALGRPFEQHVRQIALALERWRWLPMSAASPPIIVNIPAFQLYAFRGLIDREDEMLAMDVLVGAAFRHETPVFAADMAYVIFRPYWEIPADIQLYELGPMALTDRANLERLGYVLVKSGAEDAPPLPLTPQNIKRIGHDLRMRQLPGEYNALGLVKFMLPNIHDVYLHDTPVKGMFAFSRRDISHGCIRVSDPVGLAAHVLANQPGWTPDRIRQAMEGKDDNVRVDLAAPVPVYILYATAVVGENGESYFYSDVYGLDRKLDELLKKGYPYPR